MANKWPNPVIFNIFCQLLFTCRYWAHRSVEEPSTGQTGPKQPQNRAGGSEQPLPRPSPSERLRKQNGSPGGCGESGAAAPPRRAARGRSRDAEKRRGGSGCRAAPHRPFPAGEDRDLTAPLSGGTAPPRRVPALPRSRRLRTAIVPTPPSSPGRRPLPARTFSSSSAAGSSSGSPSPSRRCSGPAGEKGALRNRRARLLPMAPRPPLGAGAPTCAAPRRRSRGPAPPGPGHRTAPSAPHTGPKALRPTQAREPGSCSHRRVFEDTIASLRVFPQVKNPNERKCRVQEFPLTALTEAGLTWRMGNWKDFLSGVSILDYKNHIKYRKGWSGMKVTDFSYKLVKVFSVHLRSAFAQYKKITSVYTKNLFYTYLPTKYTAVKSNGWAEDLLEKPQETIVNVSTQSSISRLPLKASLPCTRSYLSCKSFAVLVN